MSLAWKRQGPRMVALVLLASAAFFAMRIANARGNAHGTSATSEAKPSPPDAQLPPINWRSTPASETR